MFVILEKPKRAATNALFGLGKSVAGTTTVMQGTSGRVGPTQAFQAAKSE
jgi:hypothetical protein